MSNKVFQNEVFQNEVFQNEVFQNKILPQNALKLIREYSKPLTRPDWKRNPIYKFSLFYYDLIKKKFINVIDKVIYRHINNNQFTSTILHKYINNVTYLPNNRLIEYISQFFDIDIYKVKIIIFHYGL
jgi:hypothetical protein